MKLTIFYDNYCPNCTKFAKSIEKLDWLHRIEVRQLRNELDTALFPNGTKTSYKKQIRFQQKMSGTADNITEDLRLTERVLYQFRAAF